MHRFLTLIALALAAPAAVAAPAGLTFTCAAQAHGALALNAAAIYKTPSPGKQQLTFGFDESTAPTSFAGDACSADKPFFFSLAVPDGNYQVTVVLGGPAASTNTVRAEGRRLMIEQLEVPAAGSKEVVFNVNVRHVNIANAPPDQSTVKLNAREIGASDWDEKLTLEFNGNNPSIRSISIRAVNVPTLYLAGDSTVVDQAAEPWCAWGQILPVFFGPGIAISNQAESGETMRSFTAQHRFAKIMSTLKAGDFLIIQFGHNDQKNGDPATTDFKGSLKHFIDDARARGASTILVTPMNRRNFDPSGHVVQTLGEYPQAFRDVGAEEHVPVIDLNALSKTFYEALGEQGTLHAFVHYPANTFPNQPQALKDNTHFNSYGAYELARTVVQAIRDQKLPLAQYLRPGIPPFDPAHPLPFADFKLPPSPGFSVETPYEKK